MERYTWIELSDMHLTYGAANCNGRAAQRFYQQRYPGRRISHHSIFESIHRHLRENGSFRRSNEQGRRRSVRTLRFEEQVLAEIKNNPSTSTRAIAFNIGTSNMIVWNVLREQLLHPFHRQGVQSLTFEDYPRRLEFARWYLQQCETNPEFSSLVLFTDEASFTTEQAYLTLTTLTFGVRIILMLHLFDHIKRNLRLMYGQVLLITSLSGRTFYL